MKVKGKNNKKQKNKTENKQNHASAEIDETEKNEQEVELKDVPAEKSPAKIKKNKKKVKPVETETTKNPTNEKSKKRKAEPAKDESVTEEVAAEAPKEKKKKKSKKTADPAESSDTKKEDDADVKEVTDDEENDKDPEEKKPHAYNHEDEKRTVFCGNIPNESGINKKKIKDLFAQYGKIKTIRMRSETGNVIFSKKNKQTCTSFNAYVVFETIEEAKKSLQLNGYKLMDNHIRVNMANDKKTAFQNKGTVFAGNLPFDATEKEIHELFSSVGDIEYVRIIPRKGIAYICYKKGVAIVDALKLNDTEFQGRNIRVTRCETKQKQEKKKRYARDPKTGRKIKLRVKKTHKLNENFIKGRGSKSINNPIIKKIKDSQKAKFNSFTDNANNVDKKELFRRGGKIDKDNRDAGRMKMNQKKKFFGSKVDDGSSGFGGGGKKVKKGKITKVAKDQKIIAKKLKSAALRT